MNRLDARWVLSIYLSVFGFEIVYSLVAGDDFQSSMGAIIVGLSIWLLLVYLMWNSSRLAWSLLVLGTITGFLDLWILTPSGGQVPVVTSVVYVTEVLLLLTPQLRGRAFSGRRESGSG